MKPPIPPTQPDFPKLPHSTWGWLMVLAFLSRMAFLYKTQISFSADEAGGLIHALHFGDPEWKDRLYPAARMFDGIRYWIAIALYRVTHGWLRTGALETICFNLAGCAFWVVWAYRRLSPRAALVTALFLAIPPACMDYYATLLERRQVSFVLGAVLAVVWEKGYSSSRYSFLFGLLLGWGFWEDPFILAFVSSLILAEMIKNKGKGPWLRFWKSAFLGILISGGYGLLREWQEPQYEPGYLTYGFAGISTVLQRVHLLATAFPQFWNDNMPAGYLQASSLGRAVDTLVQGSGAVFFGIWTWVLLLSAVAGYALFLWKRPSEKPVLVTALMPMALLLLFFLLSDHVWDALCFRYFTYAPVAVALGLGFLMEAAPGQRRRGLAFFLGVLMLAQSAVLLRRIYQIPPLHPADRVISVLGELGLRAGWANYWVAGPVNFLSKDKVLLNQYNLKPLDRKAEWLAYHSPRIAVVSVDGLDPPPLIQELVNKLENIGYHPFILRRFNEGWTVIELRQKNQGTSPSS